MSRVKVNSAIKLKSQLANPASANPKAQDTADVWAETKRDWTNKASAARLADLTMVAREAGYKGWSEYCSAVRDRVVKLQKRPVGYAPTRGPKPYKNRYYNPP